MDHTSQTRARDIVPVPEHSSPGSTKIAMDTMAPYLEKFSPVTLSLELTLLQGTQLNPPVFVTLDTKDGAHSPAETSRNRALSVSTSEKSVPSTPTHFYGKIGICAMDSKVLSKPCREILNRLVKSGEFETVIFGEKQILDELIELWPTCDHLISFFLNGFPLDKAIAYAKLRKPFMINDLVMQKVLWDRRLCLRLLEAAGVPTPPRIEISRDGGPVNFISEDLKEKLIEKGVDVLPIPEPNWSMPDSDTLLVDGKVLKKPFVEKPVDGEDHNVYIYYASSSGGGGRRLFRKVGNKLSEFDASLNMIRTNGLFIYEQFMDTDNLEDVKAYTVGPDYCHAETRKSPVVDGIVRRNTRGKELRYVTPLLSEEKEIAKRVSKYFDQTICGFDILRKNNRSFVIDVNGFSFVKDNALYYDSCANILREQFKKAYSAKVEAHKPVLTEITPAVSQDTPKWVFKGLVTVIRHADRTPKQKFKYLFRSAIFLSLLKGHKEEVIIRQVKDLEIVLEAIRVAEEQKCEAPEKLRLLRTTLAKKINFPGTKIQLKPVLNDEGEVDKVQFILKWGGEPTHLAKYQASDLGEITRQDIQLLNKEACKNVRVYTLSERRVIASARLWSSSFLEIEPEELPAEFLKIRKDLLDDSNAAKDLMDKVKKKIKPLLRQGIKPPKQFAWPPKYPDPYYVTKRVVALMNYHHKVMDYNFRKFADTINELQPRWCCNEDPYLFKERWDKLFKEFATFEKVDPSKISELYDTMKFDALHNREFLLRIFDPPDLDESIHSEDDEDLKQFTEDFFKLPVLCDLYPINVLAMNNFQLSKDQRQKNSDNPGLLGWVLKLDHTHYETLLSEFDGPQYNRLRELYKLAKVLFDFVCPQEYGIENGEKLDIGLLTSLPLAKQVLGDITEMVETSHPAVVAYFTKELHIYTLLNIIYELKLPMRIERNALPELDYLSQIVFELYESEDTGKKKHLIRLLLLPGCHTQDPLDVQLDEKHLISNIPKISLTRHLDTELLIQKLRLRFSRVLLPKKFTAVNISSPLLIEGVRGDQPKDKEAEKVAT